MIRRTIQILFMIGLLLALPLACGDDDDDNDDNDMADDDADDDAVDDDLDDDATDDDQVDDDDTLDDDFLDDDIIDDDTADDDTYAPLEPDYDTDFDGFGRDATGGEGGDVQTVTSLDDSGPGTLRDILTGATGPTIVRFAVDGEISLQSVLDLPSDITLDARGREVTVTDNGFRILAQTNIVLMNLAFRDMSTLGADSIQIHEGSRDIVIFHCFFDSAGMMPFQTDLPDEQISIIFGSGDITISWCRFTNHDKVLLFGNGDAPASVDKDIRVTLHHNLFENTGRRHPYLRYGQVDLYNNVIRNWTWYMDKTYGTRCESDGEILAEANWYAQSNPLYFRGAYARLGGKIRQVNNVVTETWIALEESQPDEVFARPYDATVNEPTADMVTMLEQHAGNTMPAPAR